MTFNQRLMDLAPSQTLALNQQAQSLQAQGKTIVNFTAGEPDGETPQDVCDAAKKAIDEGQTRYTDTAGIVPLREAIVEKAKRVYGRDYQANEVVVCTGGKQAIYNALFALLNPGDEVIIPTPAWVSYKSMVLMLGAQPQEVFASQAQGFVPNVADIEAAINDKTKVLLLNSPCNPTGAVYTPEFVKELSNMLRGYPDLWVISDDIYEHYVFEGSFVTLSTHVEFPKDRLVIINGVSKSHAMTGWRIGYALGPKDLIGLMKKIQSQTTSNASSISQYAALQAVKQEATQKNPFVDGFLSRRNLIFDGLSKIKGVDVIEPHGAFYIFPDMRAFLTPHTTLKNDVELCSYLLEEAGVAMVPGSAFGAPGHVRMSYGLSENEISRGLQFMQEALVNLQQKGIQ